ncbi:sulfite exporter TauE/SafE family protein [Streptococcus sobrinus]|uniref:sulfite exporter TauE/SafE family protein n=1 Tax=Streptococcus sobrinus TaxID=1310 RepID=UPI0002F21A7A|nr:sulfite exporter TauE/SafE family protein [Streptococcus sobrinus]OZV24217.1 sulfite exporter TauE/SafE family protein [Streptococcus sobrinus]
MNENLILHLIQATLVLAMIIIIIELTIHIRRQEINIFQRFVTGFWIGLVTDMLDTLGIGSFATTTTLFKLTKLNDDDTKLPGTMNAAHVIPVMVEAICFISAVKVEPLTLILMASASFFGALFGTRITKNWNERLVQLILGSLLIVAALIMAYRMLTNPGGGLSTAVHGLHGIWLVVGVVFNFTIGVLMTMGLGNYAPELIFFSLMGLSPAIAMPVMMLDAAMIMTASSTQFIKADRVNWTGYAGLVLGGVIGVLIAFKFLTSINIDTLKTLVIAIVIFTGVMLIRSSFVKKLDSHKITK